MSHEQPPEPRPEHALVGRLSVERRAENPKLLEQLFGQRDDLLPLWIAEPYVELAAPVTDALTARAANGWYGYETRPRETRDRFMRWMERRHGWTIETEKMLFSPSIGTSIALLIEMLTEPGDGVIIQPPVFTDFKPLVVAADRRVDRAPLIFDGDRYTMDLERLEAVASEPTSKVMILCNPHNPVGRVWTRKELAEVAEICAKNDVFIVADEIHADLVLGDGSFIPIASVVEGDRWAALHGPIKTFGLAGVSDTLVVTRNREAVEHLRAADRRLHLNRNNVFSLAATAAAYAEGDAWLDELLSTIAGNVELLNDLPHGIRLVVPEGTYLAWIDFRALGLGAKELAGWLSAEAGLALSPGHWFGREGAGFARMTIAVDPATIKEVITRLTAASV